VKEKERVERTLLSVALDFALKDVANGSGTSLSNPLSRACSRPKANKACCS
jgi:hypothetical protein